MLASRIASLAAVALVILCWRRPDQFTHPTLWGEEGRIFLEEYAAHGWSAFFWPVAGFQSLIDRLIMFTVFWADIERAPVWLSIAGLAVIVGVVLAIALSPTHLPLKWLCALAVLVIPTGSEVFGPALFAFWWVGLLVILALIWDRGALPLRLFFIAIGGLSSPVVVPMAGLMAIRALFERERDNVIAAGFATLFAAIQVGTMLAAPKILRNASETPTLHLALGKFVGYFLYPLASATPVDLGIIGLLVAALFLWRLKAPPMFWLLLAAMLAALVIGLARAPLSHTHPLFAGSRYFFYPYALTLWLMIWAATLSPRPVQVGLAAVAAISIGQAALAFRMRHEPLDWRGDLAACARSEQYAFPIHTSGRTQHMWRSTLTGEQCRRLLGNS
jgi:hypothetical protein